MLSWAIGRSLGPEEQAPFETAIFEQLLEIGLLRHEVQTTQVNNEAILNGDMAQLSNLLVGGVHLHGDGGGTGGGDE